MKKFVCLISQVLVFSLLFQYSVLFSPVFASEVKMEYTDPKPLHAPKIVNGVNYEYDENGNLISDGERTIEWNQDNLPIKIKKSDTEVRFFYDASGQRIVKSSKLKVKSGEEQETKTVYVNQYLTIEQSGNETIYQKYYFAQGRRIAQRIINSNETMEQLNNQLSFYHHDHLGSTVLATDINSQPVSSFLSYFPYGNSIPNYQLPITNYLYTGQELDPQSDLYNYNARLYNPKTGVFISADTINDSLNRYAYTQNNPMIFTDPTGETVESGGGGHMLPVITRDDWYNDPLPKSMTLVELYERAGVNLGLYAPPAIAQLSEEWYAVNLIYWNGEIGTIPGSFDWDYKKMEIIPADMPYTISIPEQFTLIKHRPDLADQLGSQILAPIALDAPFIAVGALKGLEMASVYRQRVARVIIHPDVLAEDRAGMEARGEDVSRYREVSTYLKKTGGLEVPYNVSPEELASRFKEGETVILTGCYGDACIQTYGAALREKGVIVILDHQGIIE